MIPKRKFQIEAGAVLLVFMYILATESGGEVGNLISLLGDWKARRAELPQPGLTEMRKRDLDSVRGRLVERLQEQTVSRGFEQSKSGLFDFLTRSSAAESVKVELKIPNSPAPVLSSEERELIFSMHLQAGYHRVGSYLNKVESGPFSISVELLELSRASTAPKIDKLAGLDCVIEGKAKVLVELSPQ